MEVVFVFVGEAEIDAVWEAFDVNTSQSSASVKDLGFTGFCFCTRYRKAHASRSNVCTDQKPNVAIFECLEMRTEFRRKDRFNCRHL